MLNCAVIMGRLTADPELRQTPNGVAVTRFSVAVDRGYVKAGEERQADFINVVCWRQTAEFVTRYFSKGSMIAVQGSIQTGSYEKDGVKSLTVRLIFSSKEKTLEMDEVQAWIDEILANLKEIGIEMRA